MALEHSAPSAGDIGDGLEGGREPDPDRVYEQRAEQEAEDEESVFHVVCHDCTFEFLEEMEGEARLATDFHRQSTGRGTSEPHDVEWAEVA